MPGQKKRPGKHYDRAVELVDDGQLAEAIIEFQRSYDLTKHFSVLYNIGQVYVSLAKPVEAIAAYEGYLVGGGKNIPAARRAEVEKELVRQKARTATMVLQILPEGGTVQCGRQRDRKSPLAQPLSVGIGEHMVSGAAEGHEPAEVKVTVASEDRRTVELRLAALLEKKAEHGSVAVSAPATETPPTVLPVAAPALPPAMSPPPPAVSAANLAPTVSTTADSPANARAMTGMQVTGLVTGAAGLVRLVRDHVLAGRAEPPRRCCHLLEPGDKNDAKAQSLQGQAQNYATAASISLIAGGALTTLGAGLYFFGAPDASGAHAQLVPAVGPGFAGINAGGVW